MLLTITDVASRLRVTRQTLNNMRKRGEFIPALKIGRQIRFRSEAFEIWLAGRARP